MEANLYNEWQLASLSPLPAWALLLLSLGVIAAVVVSAVACRGEERVARRRLLVGLRAIAAAAVILLLLEPGTRLLQTARVKNRVVFLLDRSASMKFPAEKEGKASRSQALAALLGSSEETLARLSERFALEYLAFDGGVQSVESRNLAQQLEPAGRSTDILGAIRQAAQGAGAAAGRKLSGIVVLSDGADNVELAKGIERGPARFLEGLEVPVSTLALGGGELKDVAIESVAAPDFAFVRNTIEVTATLRAHGVRTLEVPVSLKREGRVVATRNVKLSGTGAYPVAFSFSPDQTGHFVYTVESPPLPDEADRANNSHAFSLKVIRDRVRVLMVVGRPSWDVRFLRGLMKEDPNIDLISFFILRSRSDDPRIVSDDELSLIPFPVREIFHEQLRTFDLVVLQNFACDETAYPMTQYLGGIADYVRDGGALVMVGGENSFGEGRYEQTELQAVLPVEPTGLPPSTDRFRARLTSDGRRHPVAAVSDSAEESARAWSELPELEGAHLTRAKPGSRVLLDHPFLTAGGANVPVIVLGEQGRGRVMAILTDSTWSWSFGASAAGSAGRVYDRFWRNAIRWLVRDPELTPLKVTVEDSSLEPGEPVVVAVAAKLPDFGPADAAEVQLELVRAEDGGVAVRQGAVTGPDGTARSELVAPGPGAYKVVARAFRQGVSLGEAQDVVAVGALGAELADAAPRPELLQELARLTGGSYFEGVEELPSFPLIDPEKVEVGRRKDTPLWNRWWSLAIVALSLGAEWMVRRRWGFA